VPAYVVAHDATLAAIAESRPATAAALRRVKGMGPAKLERYGAEILAVVAEAPPS
jgi:DNA helicase-2/ATP-dependent DNA helicase PcrA